MFLRRGTKAGVVVAGLLCLVLCLSGVAFAGGKKLSGTLSVYTCFLENEALDIFARFEKDTGVKVKYVRLGAGEILTRIRAEAQNPQASVWFGGASDTFHAGAEAGLLEPYTAKGIEKVPQEYRDPRGVWTPATIGAIAFATNKEWLARNKISAPESWNDLLEPVYAKNVTTAHPATSGTACTLLATLIQLYGEDPAFEYFKKLDKNILQYTKSGGAPTRMCGLGETGMAFGFSQDIQQAIAEGYPIGMTFPKEGTGFEVSAMALIKNGPKDEAENARAFLDWAIGVDAQEIFGRFFRIPVNPDAPMPAGARKLSEIKTIDYDAVWVGENRERLLKRFDEDIQSKSNAR